MALLDSDLFKESVEKYGPSAEAREKVKQYKPVTAIPPAVIHDWKELDDDRVAKIRAFWPDTPTTSAEAAYDYARNRRNKYVGNSYGWKHWNTLVENLERNYYRGATETAFDPTQLRPYIIYDPESKLPIAQVAEYQGETYVVKDLTAQAEQLAYLRGYTESQAIPLNEWMAQRGYSFQDIVESEAWSGLQALIETIRAPETQTQWQEEGLDWAGQLMALGPGGYETEVGGMYDVLKAGPGAQAGMTEAERGLYGREQRRQILELRQEYGQIVEALGAQGRSTEALMQADQAASTIADAQLQYQVKMNDLNYARKEAEYAAVDNRYRYMVQMGQISATEYIQRQREHAGLQVTLYAQEMAQIEVANRQYLTEHQADMSSLQQSAQLIYQNIMVTLGVEQANLDAMQSYYDAMMLPYTRQLEADAVALEERSLDMQETQNMWSNTIAMLGVGIQALLGGAKIAAAAV